MSAWINPAHEEMLRELWSTGMSRSQMAKAINGKFSDASYSRNAIIGKGLRMGLAAPGKPSAPASAGRLAASPRPSAPAFKITARNQVFTEPEPRIPNVVVEWRDEPPGSATPLTLAAYQCKWPIGDPQDPGFTHCGQRAPDGPYCPHHASIAYAPGQTKKRSGAAELARSLRRYL